MIISENIKIKAKMPLDNFNIENILIEERGLKPLRWAVISVEEPSVTLNVSYVKES